MHLNQHTSQDIEIGHMVLYVHLQSQSEVTECVDEKVKGQGHDADAEYWVLYLSWNMLALVLLCMLKKSILNET